MHEVVFTRAALDGVLRGRVLLRLLAATAELSADADERRDDQADEDALPAEDSEQPDDAEQRQAAAATKPASGEAFAATIVDFRI